MIKGDARFFSNDHVSAAKHFFLTYFSALPHILYRSFLSVFFDPKGTQKFVHQVLDNLDLYASDPVLGSIEIREMVKGEADPVIVGSHHIQRAWDTRIFHELVVLAYLMQVIRPKKVFEIGTFVGRTTRLLAKNCPEETEIFTLDLPMGEVDHTIGEFFQDTPESNKIVQLSGDSQTFDFSQWYGECDFVWVDGCHDYSYVVKDSQEALRLCRAGGFIGWHDYRHSARWSGVTRAVRELAIDFRIQHIGGTTIACLHWQPDQAGRS